MQDAQLFCKSHQLNIDDTSLVVSLVEKHLLMSSVAQKQDIDDPLVIKNFCDEVDSLEFLEYLYLLTVADIRATRDDLWNDWKDALLKKLFRHAKQHLSSDTETLLSNSQRINNNKQALIEACITQGFEMEFVHKILERLPKDYYLRYELDDMLWHLSLQFSNNSSSITISSKISESNVVDIFVLCDDFKGLFFNLVSVVERAGLDIVDAKILTTKDNKAYNTISILQDENLDGLDFHQLISRALSNPEIDVAKPQSNYSHRYFDNKTHISLSEKEKWHLTKLEISTLDRVGVLSNIAYVLYEMDISLVNARVSTMGERVEDVFFVNDSNNKPLDKIQQSSLKIALEERL